MAIGSGFQLPFSAYEPHPDINGAYNFTPTNGGPPQLHYGDEANRIKSMIDMAPPPQLTASNAAPLGAPPPGFAAAIQAQHDREADDAMRSALVPQAHTSAPPAAPISAAGIMSGATPMAPSPATAMPNAPATAAQGVRRNIIPQDAATSAVPGESTNVNPGPNPQNYLVHTHTKAGYVPTAQKVVTEGGVQDPELAKVMGGAYADKMKADASQAEADKLLAFHQTQQSQIAAADAAKQEDAMQQKRIANLAAQEESTKEYGRVMGLAQKDLDKASSAEVDPNRIWRGKPGAQISAAIAAGLGAFGASLSHTPNFALDMINRQIDRDVEAQHNAINRGVAAKNNNILRIRDKYGVDNSTAEKLYSVFATQEAQALARKQAALQGGADAQQRLQAIDAGLAARRLKDLQDMQATMFGKAQITAEQRYQQGGDSVGVSQELKATAQAAGYLGQTGQGLGQAAAGSFQAQHEGLTAAQAAKGGPGAKESPRIAMKEAVNESAREDLPALEKADAGGTIAPDIHGVGTEARTKLNAAVDAYTSKLVDAAGDPLTDSQLAHLRSRLGSPIASVRAETRAALQHGTETYGRALNRAADRSRGATTAPESAETP